MTYRADKFILEGHDAVPTNDVRVWARMYESADRVVAQDQIGDIKISTVFLGLDHNFGDGAPLLFETMIFGGVHDQYQDRYSTWQEAEAGHKKAVAMVRP